MPKLLEIQDMVTEFRGDAGRSIALDHVSFEVHTGEILGIVGESGCGKSVTCLSALRLLGPGGAVTSGKVFFDGQELSALSEKELDKLRGSALSMIFQDALASLNPVFTVGQQLTESIRAHTALRGEAAKARAIENLRRVGIPEAEATMRKYPHTLSGGMRQRVMIAMALCCEPKLVIADEPTTALDVTIQAQIMKLLKRLREETGMSVILITHDIGLIAQMADRVLVMYAGQIVEQGRVKDIFKNPSHPYTRALMQSIPGINDAPERRLETIPGTVPENYGFMTGCRFAGRCAFRKEACEEPQVMLPAGGEGHCARCLLMKGKEDV